MSKFCQLCKFTLTTTLMFLFPQEAINLLEPMTNDPVNYVRQGALIASALIMIQQSEVTCPKVCVKYYYSATFSRNFEIFVSFVFVFFT